MEGFDKDIPLGPRCSKVPNSEHCSIVGVFVNSYPWQEASLMQVDLYGYQYVIRIHFITVFL